MFAGPLSSRIAGGVWNICEGLKRPNFPGLASSSFSIHEKLDGADDGPGEIVIWSGVELPRARNGELLGLGPFVALSSSGRGAVLGSLGTSIASTESVKRCFDGLRPLLGL